MIIQSYQEYVSIESKFLVFQQRNSWYAKNSENVKSQGTILWEKCLILLHTWHIFTSEGGSNLSTQTGMLLQFSCRSDNVYLFFRFWHIPDVLADSSISKICFSMKLQYRTTAIVFVTTTFVNFATPVVGVITSLDGMNVHVWQNSRFLFVEQDLQMISVGQKMFWLLLEIDASDAFHPSFYHHLHLTAMKWKQIHHFQLFNP